MTPIYRLINGGEKEVYLYGSNEQGQDEQEADFHHENLTTSSETKNLDKLLLRVPNELVREQWTTPKIRNRDRKRVHFSIQSVFRFVFELVLLKLFSFCLL